MSCSHHDCTLNTYHDNKCILHSNKKDKDVKDFWREVRIQVAKQNDPKTILEVYIEFDAVYFTEFEKKGLAEASGDEGLNFFRLRENQFNKVFKLTNCIFWEEADFHNLKFSTGLLFDKCIFENGLILKNMFFYKGSKVRIQNCPQIMNSNFKNTTFEDLADFYNSTFTGSAVFEKTNFQDIAVFSEATFLEDIDFKYTSFDKLAQFKNTKFHNALNLENTIIKEEINFLGIKKGIQDLSIDVANRETARIIKHSFERQDNIIEANKFYAIEMKEREKELEQNKNKTEWIIFILHKLSSNHSQEWFLPLLLIMNLTFIFSHFQFYCIDNQTAYSTIPLILNVLVSLFVLFESNYADKLIYSIASYFIYSFMTNDDSLCIVANNFNPFSIMTGKDSLTFQILIYKSAIAYLVYQFIVSVRQNTRRK